MLFGLILFKYFFNKQLKLTYIVSTQALVFFSLVRVIFLIEKLQFLIQFS